MAYFWSFAKKATPEGGGRRLNRQDGSIAKDNLINSLRFYTTTTMSTTYQEDEILVQEAVSAILHGTFPSIAAATRETPHLYGRVKHRVSGH